ncbi:MAG: hypothetical protein OXS30_11005 [Chloroflexota bacterium]|nr:hypothetical protein [Chloroflexota bacterium]
MRLLQTLVAFVTGAVAAIMWLERQTSPDRARPTPPPTPAPPPEPERVVEEVLVPDPEQASRIEQLEAELAKQRAIRTPEPGDPHPGVDAIRAARIRALELERQLAREGDGSAQRWFQLDPPSTEELVDAAAQHLPKVALWVSPDSLDCADLWQALGAMQEFAEACGGAWFEFDGDFARWCAESGHPHALDPDLPGSDEERPSFAVAQKVNRSGRQLVPTYVRVGERRCYYIDDVAGETGRMHVVGVG